MKLTSRFLQKQNIFFFLCSTTNAWNEKKREFSKKPRFASKKYVGARIHLVFIADNIIHRPTYLQEKGKIEKYVRDVSTFAISL